MDEELCNALVVGAGGAATLVLTPALVAAAGFTAGGITAGSVAAWLMSSFASLTGGGVVAGGVVATLQSVGAAGLSWLGWGATATTGGRMLGWALSSICNQTISSVDFVVED